MPESKASELYPLLNRAYENIVRELGIGLSRLGAEGLRRNVGRRTEGGGA